MNYCTATYFLLFLPLCALAYQLTPKRFRQYLLLLSSFAFIFNLSRKRILWILLADLVIWGLGLFMERLQLERNEKVKGLARTEKKEIKKKYLKKQGRLLLLGIVILVGILLVLKYTAFFLTNMNALMKTMGSDKAFGIPKFKMPIGLSFYTLSAVSYLADVYHEKIKADHNPLRLALFLCFFPCIMEGPILRYGDITEKLWEGNSITYKNLTFGAQRIIYGLFKKFIIADRLNILVKNVFTDYANYDGGIILLGAICYTIQLYSEFSGTMDVVIGSGEILGVTIPENFRHPFFSTTISEFWTRWHISLGTWFRDYIFYPVSLTDPMKKLTSASRKRLGNYYGPICVSFIALFCVWFCNGLWHGSDWNYLFFGMYHLFFILIGNLIEPVARNLTGKLKIDRSKKPWRIMQIARTIFIVIIGEMFFRAEGLRAGLSMFNILVTRFSFDSMNLTVIGTLGLDAKDLLAVLFGVIFVLVISTLSERGINIREAVAARPLTVRWTCYYAMIFAVLILGAYGMNYIPVDPIYAGF